MTTPGIKGGSIMKSYKIALLLFVAMPLTACASSHLIVEQPSRSDLRATALTLAYDETVTGVPASASAYVQHKMDEAFFGGPHPFFTHGQEMTIRYHFVGFDAGSRLGRYMLGPLGVGEAQMVLEAQFVAPDGTVLAVVRGESEVRGGFFGGSSNTAIDKAVREIRDYAVQHFRP
jgi:hypothetical protein